MSVAIWLIWINPNRSEKVIYIYFIHLFINGSWSLFFFGLHLILVSLIIIAVINGTTDNTPNFQDLKNNELTRQNDPINAPEWKWNGSIKWDSSIWALSLNYRHVNKYKWNDGIWAGTIGPYDIFDFHYNYMLTDNLKLSISALNFMDDQHKELIGGAVMGRQVIMRMTSTF